MADKLPMAYQSQQQQTHTQRSIQMQQNVASTPAKEPISPEEQAALDRLYAAIHGQAPMSTHMRWTK